MPEGQRRAILAGVYEAGPAFPFGNATSFGAPGAGGSFGFADPTAGIGYAYVTSQMGPHLAGDPRDVALRDALYSAISVSPIGPPAAASSMR